MYRDDGYGFLESRPLRVQVLLLFVPQFLSIGVSILPVLVHLRVPICLEFSLLRGLQLLQMLKIVVLSLFDDLLLCPLQLLFELIDPFFGVVRFFDVFLPIVMSAFLFQCTTA